MPLYEYECEKCGRIEVMQKVSDKPLRSCPNCKEKGKTSKVTRLVSASAFHLKGSGWYKTDYASSANGAGKKSSSEKTTGSEETKSESKSESKSEKSALKTTKGGSCGSGCGCH